MKEIGGMKKILEIFGGVKAGDIKGFRSPHLQPGGDVMFEALNRSGLMYDSTLVAGECLDLMLDILDQNANL